MPGRPSLLQRVPARGFLSAAQIWTLALLLCSPANLSSDVSSPGPWVPAWGWQWASRGSMLCTCSLQKSWWGPSESERIFASLRCLFF